MKKKESLNKESLNSLDSLEGDLTPGPSGLSAMLSSLSGKLFGIIKFVLGICLLPYVYSVTVAFLGELRLVGKTLEDYFWLGVVMFILVYFFIWEPGKVYTKGQRLLEFVFNFFKPLVKVAPYVLPVYTIILFIAYEFLSLVVKSPWLVRYSVFLLGLTMALHIVYSARTLRSRKSDFLKGNYIFGFSFIYVINLMLLALCMNLIFEKFAFINFCNNSFSLGKNIFYAVFRQLFLR